MELTGACKKCAHFKICENPCIFIENYISESGLDVWEKNIKGEAGETITIFYGSKIVRNETFLLGGDGSYSKNTILEGENPFRHFEPKLIKTGTFVDRFFHKWSYTDLSIKYEMSVENVRANYHNAKKRLFEVMEALDSGKPRKLQHIKATVKERSGALTRGQRWYLLNKLFDLTPSEIASFEGLKNSTPVYKQIKVVSDQIEAGELDLFEVDSAKTEEAKRRLEAKRARDRAYRLRNIER